MKKFALPLLVTMLVGFFAFTGCDQAVIAPEDTWCSMTQSVGAVDVDLNFYYSKTGTTITYKNKDDIVIPAGFTVVASTTVDLLGNTTPYYMHTFKSGETVDLAEIDLDEGEEADTSKSYKFTFKATMWDALYVLKYKSDFKSTEGQVPAVFKYGTSVNSFADLGFENMSWKDILIVALNML